MSSFLGNANPQISQMLHPEPQSPEAVHNKTLGTMPYQSLNIKQSTPSNPKFHRPKHPLSKVRAELNQFTQAPLAISTTGKGSSISAPLAFTGGQGVGLFRSFGFWASVGFGGLWV